MIIDDFDIEGVSGFEMEAQAPLLVDADAPLSRAIALQQLKAIRRRDSQVLDGCGAIQPIELRQSTSPDVLRQSSGLLRGEQAFGFLVGKASNHAAIINNLFTPGKATETAHGRA